MTRLKKVTVLSGIILCFISCQSKSEKNDSINLSKRKKQVELIRQLFENMNDKDRYDYVEGTNDLNISPVIDDYFYEPNEILEDLDLIKMRIYGGKLDFYTKYIEENGKSLKVYWDEKILNEPIYYWIYDKGQCENTLFLTFINDNGTQRKFSACFKDDKVYSVLPFGDGKGGVIWSRKLKHIKLEDEGRVLTVPAERAE